MTTSPTIDKPKFRGLPDTTKDNPISKEKEIEEKDIIDYYYNPNLECTCEAIFDDTHRSYCKRRQRPK